MLIENYNKSHKIEDILSIDIQAVEDFIEKIDNIYTQDDLLDINKYYIHKNGAFFIGTILWWLWLPRIPVVTTPLTRQ